MITTSILAVFVIGYLLIALEHPIKINKAATSLVTGVLCWTIYIANSPDHHQIAQQLETHFGNIAGILFFLIGAMVVVELMDAHDGFDIITERITAKRKITLLWLLSGITFFLSAILDNLTATIVMVSLQRKLLDNRQDRLLFAGMTVIAANAGGAWSPIGDVTTTMLWIGGQISAVNIIKSLFLPSLVCLLVPLMFLSYSVKGEFSRPPLSPSPGLTSTAFERNAVFSLGILVLILVPVFKTWTGLPPFMGMMLGLGIIWILTEFIHCDKDEQEKGVLSVNHAIRKIDTPSILFFLGILLAISALEGIGILTELAAGLDKTVGNQTAIGILIGLLSAIVDNVPLVAAAQGMYPLALYPPDSYIWELMTYCTGTGGSVLIIGSAAGVAAMGMEKIEFIWYLKKISWLALLGYLSGIVVYAALAT